MSVATFLIIDSDEDYALLLKASFEFYNIETYIASDAMEAIKITREYKPDAILTKLDLPGGTNAAQFIGVLRQELEVGYTPVFLLIEANDDKTMIAAAKAKGISGEIQTSISEDAILEQIKAVINLELEQKSQEVKLKKPQPVKLINIGVSSKDEHCLQILNTLNSANIVSGNTSYIWHKIRNTKLDLLVLDIQHNEAKTYELITRIQSHPVFNNISLIVLYSEDDNDSFFRLIRQKVKSCYKKPVKLAVLKEKIFKISLTTPEKKEEHSRDKVLEEQQVDNTVVDEQYKKLQEELLNEEPSEYLRDLLKFISPDQVKGLVQDLSIYRTTTDDKIKDDARLKILVNYWILYRQILNMPNEIINSIPKRLVLRFGVLDKELLSTDYFRVFLEHSGMTGRVGDIPVYYADEWLLAINNNQLKPSSSKLGVTEHNSKLEDREMDKVLSKELRTLRIMMKIMTGKYGNPYPVLETSRIKSLNNNVIFRDKIRKLITHLDKVLDPTAFDRKYQSSINHIIPNFIILPVTGSKGICWEPYEIMDRANSRGRLALPLLTMQDAEEVIIKTVGEYRWESEISHSLRSWEYESIVSIYYKLYRKKTRFDVKQRFLDDYYIWVTKESSGRAILNKETRLVMWHYVPFSAQIKQQLIKSETYRSLLNKKPVF